MKKVLIALAVVLVLLIASLFVIPVFFKSDIARIVQNQANRHINAELTIGDLSLSMFRSFPSLNVALRDVVVAGKDEFAQDTVAYIPLLEASVNLFSLISGNEIVVNKVLLREAMFKPVVSASGKENWDILKSGDTTRTADADTVKEPEDGGKGIRVDDVSVEKLHLAYSDFQSSIFAGAREVDVRLSGNFSESSTAVNLMLVLGDIYFRQDNNVWVSNTNFRWEAEIGADLKNMAFDIRRNDMALNDLRLDLTGNVAMLKDDRYRMELKLNAPDTKFESLLALVPATFRHYLDGLKTSGDFALTALVNGEYYQDHLPAFDVRLLINDASVQYPDLPEAIRKINIDLGVSNPGGAVDSTVIDLKKMSFDIAGNPFRMSLRVANLNDPLLQGSLSGVINFASLKKALPLQDISLQGSVTADVAFDGKYQYIEKEQYEKFVAKGNVMLKDVVFRNPSFPDGISVSQGSVTVTPARLNLNNLQAKINSSDFTLQGYVANYLPYILRNEVIRGNFSLVSNLVNLNELMAETGTGQKSATKTPDSAVVAGRAENGGSTIEIPRNIDVQFSTRIGTILYDNLTIKNVTGNVGLADAVATLGNLSMNMLNGSMVMNGKYNAKNPKVPHIDFGLNVNNFDINSVYNSFSFIRSSLPIAMTCSGSVSAAMKFASDLNGEMSPVMNTINGSGSLSSKGIMINDNPAMNQLAGILKNEELSRLKISDLKIDFEIQDGNIIVKPFSTSIAGNPITISGKQSVEGKMDYLLAMDVNRNAFGKDINNLLRSIPGSDKISSLEVDVKIGGTLSKPEIKPDLSKAINTLKREAEKELKNKAKDGILKGLDKLFR